MVSRIILTNSYILLIVAGPLNQELTYMTSLTSQIAVSEYSPSPASETRIPGGSPYPPNKLGF